jgi:deoxyribodipyrimidine photo-lyase
MTQPKRAYQRSIFVFRRDLRLDDNTALRRALLESGEVCPVFIFDPRQYREHSYRSLPGLEFMLESLAELARSLREAGGTLFFLEGSPANVLESLALAGGFEAVYFNRDYTPFARERDRSIYAALSARGVEVHQFADTLLVEPENGLKSDGTPYSVFTPFYKRTAAAPVPVPVGCPAGSWTRTAPAGAFGPEEFGERIHGAGSSARVDRGGRIQALAILEEIGRHKDYTAVRDLPAHAGTTRLSPHNKFGTVSVREVYHALKKRIAGTAAEPLVRQLYWRDFFTHVGFHWPHVFGRAFKPAFDRIEWSHDEASFERWCSGTTGFPIVDAGMRELNTSGYMHNRVRMIVASFLTKDLHIDWRWGERYFARQLVDYDPSVNNGSWQWAASTGCDAQPYFRIFNPWLQQAKFDPDAAYIKRWVPELARHRPAAIHAAADSALGGGYPAPMLDHATEKTITEELFEVVKEPL